MTKEDRDRAEARFNKAARAADEAKTGKTDRDAAAKAVLDNMAKLKALRLAREAAEPRAAPHRSRRRAPSRRRNPGEKAPALADWLAGQQSGGRGLRLIPNGTGSEISSDLYTGAGHSIIERVLVAAS